MMPFSTGTGLEHVGVVRPDLGCYWAELEDAGSSGLRGPRHVDLLLVLKTALPYTKQGGRGSARASPVAALMPKSVSFLEKRWTA